MRTFIAIELDEAAHDHLAAVQLKLKSAGADVKWVEPQNIHLTLKFLGEVAEDKIDKIKSMLDAIAQRASPFSISLSEIGVFPNLNSPRVIWVGIKEGILQASKLAEEIETQMANLGFPKENRPFSAHLTLGRVRSPKGLQQLKDAIENFQLLTPSSQLITHITLFQSTLTPKGSIYTALHKANLKNS